MRTMVGAVLTVLLSAGTLHAQRPRDVRLPQAALSLPATPAVNYVSMGDRAFVPDTNPPGAFATANLTFPDHAVVTELDVTVYDPLPDSHIEAAIYSVPVDSETTVQLTTTLVSSQSSDPQTLTASGFSFTVDNTSFAYRLVVNVPGYANTLQKVIGARVGYTTPTGEGTHFLAVPDRFVDTRPGPQNRGGKSTPFTSGTNYDFQITGVPGRDGNVIPMRAKGVIGNVTVVSPTDAGLLKVLPGGTDPATGTSTVNFSGATVANAFQAKLDSDGRIRVYMSGSGEAHVLIDVIAFYY